MLRSLVAVLTCAVVLAGCTRPNPTTPNASVGAPCAAVGLTAEPSTFRIGEETRFTLSIKNCGAARFTLPLPYCGFGGAFSLELVGGNTSYTFFNGTPNGTPMAEPPSGYHPMCVQPVNFTPAPTFLNPGLTETQNLTWNGSVSISKTRWENTSLMIASTSWLEVVDARPGPFTANFTFMVDGGNLSTAIANLTLLPRQ